MVLLINMRYFMNIVLMHDYDCNRIFIIRLVNLWSVYFSNRGVNLRPENGIYSEDLDTPFQQFLVKIENINLQVTMSNR